MEEVKKVIKEKTGDKEQKKRNDLLDDAILLRLMRHLVLVAFLRAEL